MKPLIFVICFFCFAFQHAIADFNIIGGKFNNQQSGPINFDTNNDGVNDINMLENSNLGIGTLTPLGNLHVIGNAVLSEHLTLTSLATAPDLISGNGLVYNVGGNLYFKDDNGVETQISNGGNVLGLWTQSGENAYYTTGNVAVGTNNPQSLLHVDSGASGDSKLILESDNSGGDTLVHFKLGSSQDFSMGIDDDDANQFVISVASSLGTNNALTIQTDRDMIIDQDLMIGTPDGAVHGARAEVWSSNSQSPIVVVNTDFSNRKTLELALDDNHPSLTVYNSLGTASAVLDSNGTSYISSNNVGIGTSVASANLFVAGNIGLSEHLSLASMAAAPGAQSGNGLLYYTSGNLFFKDTDGTEAQITNGSGSGIWDKEGENANYSSGNVGINVAAPQSFLDVNGNAIFRDDVTIVGDRYIYNQGNGANLGFIRFHTSSIIFGGGSAGLLRFDSDIKMSNSTDLQNGSDENVFTPYIGDFDGSTNVLRLYKGLTFEGNNMPTGMSRTDIDFRIDSNNDATAEHFQVTKDTGTVLFKVAEDGNFGIGTDTANAVLHVNGNALFAGNILLSGNSAYDIGTNAEAARTVYSKDYVMISDKRLKTNIEKVSYGLEEILKLNPVIYNWKDQQEGDKQIGLLAQEVQEKIPEVISGGSDANQTLGVRYTSLIPVLINAIKEQQQEIRELKENQKRLETQLKAR